MITAISPRFSARQSESGASGDQCHSSQADCNRHSACSARHGDVRMTGYGDTFTRYARRRVRLGASTTGSKGARNLPV